MTTQESVAERLARQAEAVFEGAENMSPEELAQIAKDAIEPGDAKDTVVHEPSPDTPFGLSISDIQSAGWAAIWHVGTREPSLCNRNQLAQKLALKDENGKRIFTTSAPKKPPERGSMKCLLHTEHADADFYRSLGLPTCRKSNLRTSLDVRTHMRHRHQREWEVVEEHRREIRETEEREVRQAIIGGQRPQRRSNRSGQVKTEACDVCEEVLSAGSAIGLHQKMQAHKRQQHEV